MQWVKIVSRKATDPVQFVVKEINKGSYDHDDPADDEKI